MADGIAATQSNQISSSNSNFKLHRVMKNANSQLNESNQFEPIKSYKTLTAEFMKWNSLLNYELSAGVIS